MNKFRLLLLVLVFGVLSASATVVTFDDLPPVSYYGVLVPDGYGGINWEGHFCYMNSIPALPAHSGTEIALGYNAALDINLQELTFSFVTPDQTFDGAWFNTNLQSTGVQLNLYNDGVLVHTATATIMGSTPFFVSSGYAGPVDSVGVYGTLWYALDDVTYNSAPEPSTAALAGVPVLLLAVLVVRRRKRAELR